MCDRHQANLEKVRAAGSDIRTTMKAEDVIGAEDVELVVITTQAATHYGLVQAAMESGKHVFVEKPFTLDLAEARELGELADKKKRVLMVDHTFMFTPAFERVKQVVAGQGQAGKPPATVRAPAPAASGLTPTHHPAPRIHGPDAPRLRG